MKKLNILSKFSWPLFGNLLYALSQWLIVTIIARFGTLTDIGIYSMALAITAPISLFFNLQLATVLATDSKNENTFSQYFSSRIINIVLYLIVALIVILLYSNTISFVIAATLMAFSKGFESLSDICMGLYQKQKKVELIGKSQVYRSLLSLLIVGGCFILTKNIILSIFGLMVIMLLRFINYDLKWANILAQVTFKLDGTWKKLFKMSLPLGVIALINSLNTNIPRYFLEYFTNIELVGVFSALSYVLIAFNMIISPISLIIAPKIGGYYAEKDLNNLIKFNVKIFLLVSVLSLILIFGVWLFGEFFVGVLYGQDYIQYSDILSLICITTFFTFLTTFCNLNIVAARAFKYQPLLSILVTIFTLVNSVYFINLEGIKGAAITLVLSTFLQTLLSLSLMIYTWVTMRKQKRRLV